MGSDGDLDGRTVVVTGAASGIGRATALQAIEDGARVVGLDDDAESLDRMAGAGDGGFHSIRCDVSQPEDVSAAFRAISGEFGEIDGLVNSAGVGGEPGDVTATGVDFWTRTIGVNLTGVFLVSRTAVPLIRKAGGGSIVHVASQLGLVGTTDSPAYCASKGGVVALGRAMALDHAAEGIQVNTVCPGPVDTPLFARSSGPGKIDRLLGDQIPVGRLGRPDEIASVIVFLLGLRSEFLTGAVITVDGGYTAR